MKAETLDTAFAAEPDMSQEEFVQQCIKSCRTFALENEATDDQINDDLGLTVMNFIGSCRVQDGIVVAEMWALVRLFGSWFEGLPPGKADGEEDS